jgi:peroxiredoxin
MADQTSGPRIGELAPDFELRDQHREPVRLSSFRGQANVVLVFYPFAFSGICTGELCEIRDDLSAFMNESTITLAVSADSVHTLRAFAEAEGLKFPLLSDFWPHGEVARAYGVFNEAVGAATRGTFVIDKAGVLRWSLVQGLGERRDVTSFQRAVAELG